MVQKDLPASSCAQLQTTPQSVDKTINSILTLTMVIHHLENKV